MRPVPEEKTYDITVENAGLPGLPAPETLTTTNQDFSVISKNANGSVLIMTTNNQVVTGVPLDKEVVTQPQPDPTLDETENILENYDSLLSTNQTLIDR